MKSDWSNCANHSVPGEGEGEKNDEKPEAEMTGTVSLEDEYRSLFSTGVTAEMCAKKLKERGLSGQLRGTRLRSIVWKVLLEVLPPYVSVSEWPSRITQARKDYNALCSKFWSHSSLSSLLWLRL